MKTKLGSIFLCGSLLLLTACRPGQQKVNGPPPATDPISREAPSPVSTPTDEVLEFDPATVNAVVPKDVLAEVNFYGGGGGIYYCNLSETYDEPRIARDPRDEELMQASSMTACGWGANEVLEGIIQDPNGNLSRQSIQAKEQLGKYYAILSFRPWITDPVGVYTFILKGKGGMVISNAYFRRPQGPRLTPADDDHVFLSGFRPHEAVRMIYYAIPEAWWHGKFSGWQEYKVDETGQLMIRVRNLIMSGLVVIGSQSGELHVSEMEGSILKDTTLPLVGNPSGSSYRLDCPPERAAQAHLQPQTAISIPKNNILFANPRPDARVVARLSAGIQVFLSGGPYCVGGQLWWSAWVKSADELGYMMDFEGQNNDLNPYP